MMQIHSIEIENYRQYKGKHHIDFTRDAERTFVVIEGANGTGKTNLLNAVLWCLYGKEEHLEKTPSGMPIINERVLKSIERGKTDTVRVRVAIGEEEPKYLFERVELWGPERRIDNDFSAWFLVGKDWKPSEQPNITVNFLLPEGIKHFFFFNGERLNDFFRTGSNEKVRQAILDVSQVSLLDTTINHLGNIRDSLARDAKGLSSEAEEIQERIERIRAGIEDYRNILEKYQEEKRKVGADLDEAETWLREHSISQVKTLQRGRDQLEREIDRIDRQRTEIKEASLKHLISSLPFIFGLEALHEMATKVDKEYRTGELPPKIKDTYLKELLQRGRCICGTDLESDRDARKQIMELLAGESSVLASIHREVTSGKFLSASIFRDASKFAETREKYGKQTRELDATADEYRQALKETNEEMKKIDEEEVRDIENRRSNLFQRLESLQKKIAIYQDRIENGNRKVSENQAKYRKELKKERKHARLLSRLELCDKGLCVLEKLKSETIREVRNTVEERTKEYFLSLIWKKDTYEDIRIDDDYTVSVKSVLGSESLGSLSAGERQVLALSFIAALREISGFDAPLIIDTALGRISGEPKDNIAECLPRYLSGTQVTLLLTDQEYTPSVREKLAKKVGLEYELVFSDGETKVREFVK
jgi:DNA sulfur modification protein DndD